MHTVLSLAGRNLRSRSGIVKVTVGATLRFRRSGTARVTVLDHDGLRTDRVREIADGVLDLDTGRDRSPYYLVEF